MVYTWDFSAVFRDSDLLLLGLANSLWLTGVAFLIGLPAGIVLALLRMSRRRAVALPVGFVVDFFRGTPALVQLFWFFFAMPRLTSLRLNPTAAALVTLSILSAAFCAEVFRAGIQSIERGQWEGARAIGMSPRQMMRRVILPQAVKRMIPMFLERLIELLKTSTIASTISFPDILFEAQDISHKTYRALEVFTTAAALYLVVITLGSQLTRLLERRLARSGESTVH